MATTAEADFMSEDESSTEKEYTFRFKMPKVNMPSMPSTSDIVPEEVTKHFLNAQRENLLAVRSFIDAVIGRIENMSDEASAKSSTRIEID